ncbi:dr1-associated corepressor [Homalodisca vitripennis]|uniref:dr1-associated corepressor n=1 Tax=Homalodisca vitripennis TaxID=197043 RepID=UPI001EEA4C7C|nr:dr1-associated corepressor [Homalodisca vitripennis]
MPSKKKKYNARFPAGRIKKIMQTDEEVGKVAQAVPVIISRTLELFVGSLLTKAMQITSAKNAKTLSPSHMKQCILSEQRFDFLKDLVKTVQDSSNGEDELTAGPGLVPYIPERRRSTGGSSTIKQETIVKDELVIDDNETIEPHSAVANCSTLHLAPNFYSETTPEQRIGIHQPPVTPGYQPPTGHGYLPPTVPVYKPPSHSYPEPSSVAHSPVLVMDEDYDT